MNAAVFIEPAGSLREAVTAAKRFIAEREADRPYLADPPHCTVLAGTYTSVEELERATRLIAALVRPFKIATDGLIVFERDPLAPGKDTIAFGIARNDSLFDLQRRLATASAAFAIGGGIDHSEFDDLRWRESARKFGWPFVGEHWTPHFTIAALDALQDRDLVQALRERENRFEMAVDALSVWEISAARSRRRSTIPFTGK